VTNVLTPPAPTTVPSRPLTPITFADDSALRAVGALGVAGVALIHFVDMFDQWHETKYLAVLFGALVAGCVLAGALLLGRRSRAGWMLAGGLALATVAGYVVSRGWGLPKADGDIGNWTEPLGAASLFIEGCVVLLAAWALGARRPRSA
jgi:hypothetical protein